VSPIAAARALAGLVVAVAVAGAACGGDDGAQVSGQDSAQSGHAALRFSGAVSGSLDADTEVACFEPAEQGDRFTVSIDADEGLPVGPQRLMALDVSIPDYDGPRAYDIRPDQETEAGFDADEFFLLFAEPQDQPFVWGTPGSAGSVTIDEGGESGRLALRGWKNGADQRVDVEGTFRCGRSAGR
jgi:hypothetical protein